MTAHKVAGEEELSTDGSRVITEVEGREIAVFLIDGEYHAVANHCPHQSGPLCEGELAGRMDVDRDDWELYYDSTERIIRCPWHAWRFDVTTGDNIQDARYAVPTYEVSVEDGEIYVEL